MIGSRLAKNLPNFRESDWLEHEQETSCKNCCKLALSMSRHQSSNGPVRTTSELQCLEECQECLLWQSLCRQKRVRSRSRLSYDIPLCQAAKSTWFGANIIFALHMSPSTVAIKGSTSIVALCEPITQEVIKNWFEMCFHAILRCGVSSMM